MPKELNSISYNLIVLRGKELRCLNNGFIPAQVVFRHSWKDIRGERLTSRSGEEVAVGLLTIHEHPPEGGGFAPLSKRGFRTSHLLLLSFSPALSTNTCHRPSNIDVIVIWPAQRVSPKRLHTNTSAGRATSQSVQLSTAH
jgi:hypothetical protein